MTGAFEKKISGMEYKKVFLLVVGGLMSIMCLFGIDALVVLLKYADTQEEKAIVVMKQTTPQSVI